MNPSNESQTMQRALEGRTALITGASRGLGRAIATGFAAAGSSLVLIGRVRSNLEAAAEEIRRGGSEVHCFPYDLSRVEGIPELYEWIVSAAGEVNILINVAGKNFRVPAIDFPLDEWRSVVDLNLTAPFVLSQCFARPLIREGKPGKIVNIASLHQFAWQKGYGAFSIGQSQVEQVKNYIRRQDRHHRRVSFQDEFREFLRRYQVDFDERYVWD